MLNSVGASTQLCLTPFVTSNGSIVLDPCKHAIVELPHRCYKPCHNFPKPITTDCVKYIGKVDKGHIAVHILFLAFLVELRICKDHIYCPSVLPESTDFLVEVQSDHDVNSGDSIAFLVCFFCQYLPSN